MSAVGNGQSAGGEVQSAGGGEGKSVGCDMPPLKDSTNDSYGRHSLEKRARKEHHEVVFQISERLKVPFHLECKGCGSVIAEGVRINAEKRLVGYFYKFQVWRFSIKCAYCGQKIVMERHSVDSSYEVIKGGRKTSLR